MKYIYTLLFVAISAMSFAQGNLQFNQVLTFVGNTTETNIYTVPTGKVAKITKAIHFHDNNAAFRVGLTFNGYTGQQYSTFDLSGMWLRENDFLGSIVGTNPQNNKWILSIIEYNIIP